MSSMQANKIDLTLVFILILVLQTFLLKIPFFFEISWLKSLDELVTLFAAIYVLHFLIKKPKNEVLLPLNLIILFGIFSTFGVLSGFANDLKLSQIAMQFILEVKILIVILFCIFSFSGYETDKIFYKIFKYLVVINVPFVIWQLVLGGSYDSFFASGSHFALFYSAEGGEFTRVAGIFWFTGAFAVFCALSCGYFLICNITTKKIDSNTLFFTISLLMLLATRSMGELYAFIFGLIALGLAYKSSSSFKFLAAIVLSIVCSFFFYFYAESFIRLAGQLGLIDGLPEYTARALFMMTSLDIAQDNFPLGSGFGSFGGQSAVVHDSVLFYKYYISHEWYFSEGLFLTDTFWPKIIAETGWFGCVAMLVFILYPLYKCYGRSHPYQLFSIYALSMMFFQSLSAPIYNEPLSMFLSYFMLGSLFHDKK